MPTRRSNGNADVLTQRQLNRALLVRQHLLARVSRPAIEEVQHLVGLQAQVPTDPYVALWSRLEGFTTGELSGLVERSEVVRTPVMRGTLHLVTAEDALSLRALTQPVLERMFWKGSPFARHLEGLDAKEVLAAGRAFLDEKPRPSSALARHLGTRWPDRDATALAYALRFLTPMIQVPPRGMWGASHQPTWATTETWLGRPVPDDPSPDTAIIRYLAAFGPASVMDVQAWCWRTKFRDGMERLRPSLRTFRSETGIELFDLPDAPRPDPDTPAPPRFLPEYDNLVLSHADRTRVIDRVFGDDWWKGACLIDGVVRATWRFAREPESIRLEIKTFIPIDQANRNGLAEEGERLLAFVAPEAVNREIRFFDPEDPEVPDRDVPVGRWMAGARPGGGGQ
jgi:Winged helix DNA-binding domain